MDLFHNTFGGFGMRVILVVATLILMAGCSTKEEQFGNYKVHYADGASKEDAKKLGGYLMKSGAQPANPVGFMLTKNGAIYEIRVKVKPGLDTDNDTRNKFKQLASEFSKNVFDGQHVDIHLCDENKKTLYVAVGR